MDFRLTPEQTGFAQSLTELMTKADSVAAARAWAAGDHAPGQALWKRLADQGVTALVLPEDDGGLGGTPVDLVVAFEVLGHQLAVGPWIESAALAPQAEGEMVTAGGLSAERRTPSTPTWPRCCTGPLSESLRSVDTTRRLFEVHDAQPFDEGAIDLAVLACSAELLGCGERLLADSVEYVQQRKQYGRTIGSYQAIKHQLADVRIALDFARPLVHGAALSMQPPRRVRREGGGRRRGVPRLAGGAAGARRDRLHRRVRPRPLDQPGACAGRGMGRLVVPPGPDRRRARSLLMHFARTEEQDELASIVASLLDKRSDSAAVRAAMESEAGYDEALWQALCEQVGVAALAVPEEYDGFGASLVETAVVLEELGRNLAPTPAAGDGHRHRGPAAARRRRAEGRPAAPDRRRRGRPRSSPVSWCSTRRRSCSSLRGSAWRSRGRRPRAGGLARPDARASVAPRRRAAIASKGRCCTSPGR